MEEYTSADDEDGDDIRDELLHARWNKKYIKTKNIIIIIIINRVRNYITIKYD